MPISVSAIGGGSKVRTTERSSELRVGRIVIVSRDSERRQINLLRIAAPQPTKCSFLKQFPEFFSHNSVIRGEALSEL